MSVYNLNLGGMSKKRIYELIDKGIAYEEGEPQCERCSIVEGVIEALCGKCTHNPLDDGCLKQTVCMKRGSVRRIMELGIEE